MNNKLITLNNMLSLNTRLLVNCFENVSNSQAQERINEKTNPMIFILMHILDARYYLARYVGIHIESPYKKISGKAKKFEDIKEYPTISEILEYWKEIGELIYDGISNLEEEKLEKKSSFSFPVNDNTVLGAITFLIHHESYHIGQLGYLRKLIGLEAMSYE
ncbi:DinB family protein [Bacteroidota bacterium]